MAPLRCALVVALTFWWGAAVGQQPDSAITFEVAVLPEAARHLELLATPAYAALALENIGLSPSVSSRLTILSRKSFQIKIALVRFTGRDGSLFNYEAGISLPLGVATSEFVVRVQVDTSAVPQGMVTVRVFSPLDALIPREFIERVEFKIRTLANLQSQHTMIEYLDRLAAKQKDQGREFEGMREGMLEAIAFEAFNGVGRSRAGSRGRGYEAGELRSDSITELRSDQITLLTLFTIWLVGFPLFLLFVKIRRKGQRAT